MMLWIAQLQGVVSHAGINRSENSIVQYYYLNVQCAVHKNTYVILLYVWCIFGFPLSALLLLFGQNEGNMLQ